jgi:hypothetical protein
LGEELKKDKTYRMTCKLGFNMRGTHRDYAVVKATLSIVYNASAVIDRTIVSNDGHTIVEDRHFREVRANSLETPVNLERVNLDFGIVGDLAETGTAILAPDKSLFVSGGRRLLEGANLAGIVKGAGWDKTLAKDLLDRNESMRVLTYAGRLEGKRVRLTYENSTPPRVHVTPLEGELNNEEVRFLASSVLPVDSLVFPDLKVKEGERWKVPGIVFIGLLDPTLLATTDGEITLQRDRDQSFLGGKAAVVRVVGGQLEFKESTMRTDSIGSFQAREGSLLFSFKDKMFVQGTLRGRGDLTIKSTDHILCETRSDVRPELHIAFTCKMLDNP